jgi:ParB-like chromosome segregation protein Spo0J
LRGEDSAHIQVLSQLEKELPPILVHQASMRIVDGMHRFRAAILRGEDTIAIRFLNCDENEVFATAVEMNVRHGLPLSLADRKAAACQILETNPQWSDRKVASISGLSHKTVGSLRARATGNSPQMHGRMGRDGRIRQLSSALGREKAAGLIREDPEKSLREIARLAGVSVGTVRDVRMRLDCGLDPVPTARQAAAGQPNQGAPAEAHAAGPDPRAADGAAASPNAAPAVDLAAEEQCPQDRDAASILQSLSKDPSLRFSESGRLLVRLLQASMASSARLAVLVDKVPPHQAGAIAQLARACADSLSVTARQLEPTSARQ